MHHRHALGHPEGHIHIVFDDDEADMLGQAVEDLDQLGAFGGREARRGFVEQDKTRRPGQRHADFKLALLAVTERAHPGIQRVLQIYGPGQDLAHPERRVRGPRPAQGGAARGHAATGHKQIVAHAQILKQQRDLISAAQAAPDPLRGRQQADVLAKKAHAPGGEREIAAHGVEQCGLAGPV